MLISKTSLLFIVALAAAGMLACGAASTPPSANGAVQAVEPPVVQPIELPTPAPPQVAETTPPTAGLNEGPGPAPSMAQSPVVVAPELRPILTVATLVPAAVPTPTVTPAPAATPVPTPTAVPTPTVKPTPTAVPTALPTATVTPALAATPTAQPQQSAVTPGQAGTQQIAAKLAELGSALKWIAYFNNALKNWSAYDPTGSFVQDQGLLPIPVNPPVGTLTSLIDGEIYWIALSRNATFKGETLLAGLSSIAWRGASTSVATPVPRATPTAQPIATPAAPAEIVQQVAGMGSALKWVAYLYNENGNWQLSLYDPTGAFPGVNALVPTSQEVPVSPLTRLVEGREYLFAVSRDIEFRGMRFAGAGSGTNVVKWR